MSADAPSDTGSFWMIMSTLTLASASAVKMRPATPGLSGTPSSVTRASSREWVTAVISGRSIVSSSPTTKVPGSSVKLERQWMRTPWLRAYSTLRSCSTPAPEADISSISSKVTTGELAGVGHDPRVGGEHSGHVGVDLAHLGLDGRPSATAVVSLPPRPSVVTSLAVDTPWKPATSTTSWSSSASRIRSALTSRMRALV